MQAPRDRTELKPFCSWPSFFQTLSPDVSSSRHISGNYSYSDWQLWRFTLPSGYSFVKVTIIIGAGVAAAL